jgi:ribosomal peptide maturation radical SAM protein 1
MEAARGCWWGQKHHCTFCGLNDMIMPFRAKEPDRVFDELRRAVEKHQVLDVFFADNILDQRYLKDLLPRFEALGWDLGMFFETKANQVYSQLAQMARAGVSQLQPGIESFSTPVLQRMRKGVTGWQNVRFLRDCRTLGIDPLWNLLYGFPGETDEDYAPMVAQLPHLVHLRPPMGATRLELTRFSPYFTDPSLGLPSFGPAAMYADIYDLPDTELADLVYVLRSPHVGASEPVVDRMKSDVDAWIARGVGPSLVAFAEGDRLVLVDERDNGRSIEYGLAAPAAAGYSALRKGRSRTALLTMMAQHPAGPPPERIDELLDGWVAAGLVFRDDDTYVALATGLAYS